MAACNFTLATDGNAADMLEKAKMAIEKQSGTFTGDGKVGNFNVSFFWQEIVGAYNVSGTDLNIIIEKKPFMVPCSTIENFLRSQL